MKGELQLFNFSCAYKFATLNFDLLFKRVSSESVKTQYYYKAYG